MCRSASFWRLSRPVPPMDTQKDPGCTYWEIVRAGAFLWARAERGGPLSSQTGYVRRSAHATARLICLPVLAPGSSFIERV